MKGTASTNQEIHTSISTDHVREIFSDIAQNYDRFNAISSLGAYKRWLSGMMAQAPIKPSDEVLDIAGGTGEVTFSIAQTKHPSHICCTDISSEMLAIARKRYANGAACKVQVDFGIADAQNMPYPDASFDIVTTAYGIRNMPKRERALSEILRVLRPGGTFVCLEFSTPPNLLWRSLYYFYLKHLIPFWGSVIVKDRESCVYLAESIKAFPDQTAFANMIKDAGFKDVTWKNYTGGIACVHVGKKTSEQHS